MLLTPNIDEERFMNINLIDYQEELYQYAKNLNFSKLNLDLLKNEVDTSAAFEEKILAIVCNLLGYDYQYLIDNINFSRVESDIPTIQKLIKQQETRIKKLLIDFLYELLPFNYLIKISKKRGKYNIKDDLREDIIALLNDEIQKSLNIEDTLDLVYDALDAKLQKEQYLNLSKKITLKSNKIITENKFLIGIIDEIEYNSLEKLVDAICSDKMVWDNLHP